MTQASAAARVPASVPASQEGEASPIGRRATLVAIASASHSGSTLLDLLLGNHPDVCSAGEMNRLTLHAADRVCACGSTVTACEYWNSVRHVITRHRNRSALIPWDECHTDLPPQTPTLRLDGTARRHLVDGAPVTPDFRRLLADKGLIVSDRAMLSRKGVRDFSWRITDPVSKNLYVLRTGEKTLDVYEAEVEWKNPLRFVPEPLEVSLAVGSPRTLSVVRACSRSAEAFARVVENSWMVADAMASVSQTKYVVDSSKSPVRLKLLYMLRPDRVRVLHLVRDGRAVVASALRRRAGESAATAARIWKRDNRNLSVMLRSVPDRLKLGVRYEALCEDPRPELQRVCDFLGLEFDEKMPALWQRAVHNIPGNPLLFNRSERAIRKDERWRRDLSDSDLRAFDRAAGRLNRSLGYI